MAENISAVRDITLDVLKGDFISIMGPSGSGKTTLLDSLGCLSSISSGMLEILGQDISHVKEEDLVKIRRGNIGFVFQEFFLIPTLTAKENVELPLHFAGVSSAKGNPEELLEKVGLGQRVNHLPKELSGGERQRVAIARALITSPKLLIADEPTGNLDTKNTEEIFSLFRRLNEEDGVTIVVATHDINVGKKADKIIHLTDGKIDKEEVLAKG